MKRSTRLGLAGVLALAVPAMALAQQDTKPAPSGNDQQAAPSTDQQAAPSTTQSAVAGTPDLAVATVKAQSGLRVSKIVGAAVYNGNNQEIGTVDDLIMDDQGKATLAVIAVGGFLGVGSKLVAEPYTALKFDQAGKVLLPDASKESLNGMPSFTYGP